MKDNENNILGCFVSGPAAYHDDVSGTRELLEQKGELFRSYIWGPAGISSLLKTLRRQDYGRDLDLVLLQFYLLPLIEELAELKDIEAYRKKEKSIGIPIIIHDENFFNRSDIERRGFLKSTILEKLDLLSGVIRTKKLDTNLGSLKSDVAQLVF